MKSASVWRKRVEKKESVIGKGLKWDRVPDDVVRFVLSFLLAPSIVSFRAVHRRFLKICDQLECDDVWGSSQMVNGMQFGEQLYTMSSFRSFIRTHDVDDAREEGCTLVDYGVRLPVPQDEKKKIIEVLRNEDVSGEGANIIATLDSDGLLSVWEYWEDFGEAPLCTWKFPFDPSMTRNWFISLCFPYIAYTLRTPVGLPADRIGGAATRKETITFGCANVVTNSHVPLEVKDEEASRMRACAKPEECLFYFQNDQTTTMRMRVYNYSGELLRIVPFYNPFFDPAGISQFFDKCTDLFPLLIPSSPAPSPLASPTHGSTTRTPTGGSGSSSSSSSSSSRGGSGGSSGGGVDASVENDASGSLEIVPYVMEGEGGSAYTIRGALSEYILNELSGKEEVAGRGEDEEKEFLNGIKVYRAQYGGETIWITYSALMYPRTDVSLTFPVVRGWSHRTGVMMWDEEMNEAHSIMGYNILTDRSACESSPTVGILRWDQFSNFQTLYFLDLLTGTRRLKAFPFWSTMKPISIVLGTLLIKAKCFDLQAFEMKTQYRYTIGHYTDVDSIDSGCLVCSSISPFGTRKHTSLIDFRRSIPNWTQLPPLPPLPPLPSLPSFSRHAETYKETHEDQDINEWKENEDWPEQELHKERLSRKITRRYYYTPRKSRHYLSRIGESCSGRAERVSGIVEASRKKKYNQKSKHLNRRREGYLTPRFTHYI